MRLPMLLPGVPRFGNLLRGLCQRGQATLELLLQTRPQRCLAGSDRALLALVGRLGLDLHRLLAGFRNDLRRLGFHAVQVRLAHVVELKPPRGVALGDWWTTGFVDPTQPFCVTPRRRTARCWAK